MTETKEEAGIGLGDVLSATALAVVWFAVVRPGPLDLAYFWDEADVYVPGARWVAEHGLDVTPGVFPDDYSRGHPPLLYLLAGAAFSVFGPGPTTGHLLVLPFAVAALVGTYLLGVQLFDRRVGAASALLLATTPLFMTMGNMLLPEMPLTALAVLSLLALARGRLGLAALFGVAAVLIKETGIFAAAAVGFAVLYDARLRGVLRKRETLLRALTAATPLFALMAFLGWQRATAGYFIFPHHQGLFVDRPFALENLITVGPSLLAWHGRWLVVGAAVVAYFAFGRRLGPTDMSAAGPVPDGWVPGRRSMFVAFFSLIVLNWLFFVKMFWLERYALPAHPGLLIAATGALFAAAHGRRVWAARGVVVVVAVLGLVALFGPAETDAEEHTFAYADVIETHRAAFAEIEPGDERPLVLTRWPMTVELSHPYLGYVDRVVETRQLRYLTAAEAGDVTHVLLQSTSSHAAELREEAQRRGLVSLGEYQVNDAPRLELYGP